MNKTLKINKIKYFINLKKKKIYYFLLNFFELYLFYIHGDWGLGIGDWGLGIGDWVNPQSPIPNPQSPFFMNNFLIV